MAFSSSDLVVCYFGYLQNISHCANNPSTASACVASYTDFNGSAFTSNCYSFPSSSSSDCNYSSSSSVVETEFDWELSKQGFKDAFPVFLAIFAVYCVVKVLHLPFKQ